MAGLSSVSPPAHRGTSASPGRALGPAFRARDPSTAVVDPVAGDPAASLRAAVALAAMELRSLSTGADPQSAGVLDFQIEMLLDEEILVPALERIAKGDGAALAWAGAMDAYIDAFTADSAPDDAFAARVSDLIDLRHRVLDALAGRTRADFPEGAVYAGPDMPPSLFLAHDWSKGGAIALSAGSAISHVALLARARGVPMVIGLGDIEMADGQVVLVDGDAGLVRVEPAGAPPATPPLGTTDDHLVPTTPPLAVPSETRAGGETSVRLCVNLNTLSDLDSFAVDGVDGVGLVRTEFLFASAAEVLFEERHFACYREIVHRLAGRPVALRMLDYGGDKTLAGIAEGGPASLLGERGIRLLLAHPELARIQARALMRAAALGPVSVLLPMVTVPAELRAMNSLFEEEAARLARLDIPARLPPIGIMVEVPAAALTLDLFEAAAFFSVGTNDLMQYLSAAARDNPAIAALNAQSEPALFRLLAQICATVHGLGKPVSVCGDLASTPHGLARLLAAGFRDVSVAPRHLPAIRAALAGVAPARTEG